MELQIHEEPEGENNILFAPPMIKNTELTDEIESQESEASVTSDALLEIILSPHELSISPPLLTTTTLQPHFINTHLEILPSPLGGSGVFARHTIAPGTLLLREPPLFLSNSLPPSVHSSYAQLSAKNRSLFDTLSWYSARSADPIIGRYRTNSFYIRHSRDPEVDGALGVQVSRFNHACVPAAKVFWEESEKEGREKGWMKVFAVREVEVGEEVTISYLCEDDPMGLGQRLDILERAYGFVCKCEAH